MFNRPYFDPDFPQLFAVGFNRPGETIGNEDYFRIGDSSFSVPPTGIKVHDRTENEIERIPRASTGIVTAPGFSVKIIDVDLVFSSSTAIFGLSDGSVALDASLRFAPTIDGTGQSSYLSSPPINSDSLAALIAQFKKSPILPVSNRLLNATHGVWAVTCQNLTAATVMDDEGMPVPNCIQVHLELTGFEWQIYMPEISDFDGAHIWPVFRWNWQQMYAQTLPGEYRVYAYGATPPSFPALTSSEQATISGQSPTQITSFPRYSHISGMTADYQYSVISRDWVKQLNTLDDTYAKLQAYALSDEFKVDPTQQDTFSALQEILQKRIALDGPEYARMEPIDLGPDLTLKHMAAGMDNTYTFLRVGSQEQPTMQHMGRSNIRLVATFHASSDDALARITQMVEYAREVARDQRFDMVAGFIGFENEFASLFGVNSVIITDIQSKNLEGFPGQYLISIEMIDFDRQQRRYEILQNASNVSNIYGIQDHNPIPTASEQGPSPEPASYTFWQRYIQQIKDGDPSHPTNKAWDPVGRPTSAQFNQAYIQQAKEQLAAFELYPDLMLPTWERLQLALSNGEIFPIGSAIAQSQLALQQARWVIWNEKGRFVDPDFYLDYPNTNLAKSFTPPTDSDLSADSYFEAVVNSLMQIEQSPLLLQIDGSLASATTSALFDSYGQGALYGPAPYVPETEKDNVEPSRGSGHMHAIVNVPTFMEKQATSLICPVQSTDQHKGTVNVDGISYQATWPATGVQGMKIDNKVVDKGEDYTNASDPYNFQKLQGGLDAINLSTGQIFGTDDAVGRNQTPLIAEELITHHPVDLGFNVADEHGRLIATMSALIEQDVTGRLVQAFPSYAMQLVDEGPRLGWVKLFPNFFGLQAMKSFSVTNDRRDPISTLTIEFLNTYGNISNYQAAKLNQTIISAETNFSGWPTIASENVTTGHLKEAIGYMLQGLWQPIRTLFPSITGVTDQVAVLRAKQDSAVMVQPGVRIHLRAGYGSNGAKLPILFNGRIVDIGQGETVQIIAQGDGEELSRLIPSADNQYNTINRPQQGHLQNSSVPLFNAYSYEPRELIMQMLNSQGESLFNYNVLGQWWNWVKKNARAATNAAIFQDNPIGITHFGNPYLFTFWTSLVGVNTPNMQTLENLTPPYPAMANQHLASIIKPVGVGIVGTLLGASGSGSRISAVQADNLSALKNQFATRPQSHGAFNDAIVGVDSNLIQQGILSGYGETGENVFPIYTPFDTTASNFGSLFSKANMTKYQAAMTETSGAAGTSGQIGIGLEAGAVASTASTVLGTSSFPDLPPLTGHTVVDMVGPLARPGACFNMYTSNKTVWDVISLMAQSFPPYIAAVRPFEYRSTLFYGSPYWTFRYDYQRVSSSDLGLFSDDTNDKYFGYPIAYKTRPFMQFHFYDSRTNLLDNKIRASDEDTYSDVVAMWYGGQGYSHTRPEPMAQHQQVDWAIVPEQRKTVIVDTDYVGMDSAPSAAANISSMGTSWIGYMLGHLAIPFSQIGFNGIFNHWTSEKSFRQTTRAILRDYQRLMYQGTITVLGDPTAWPYDIMYLNDGYTDIKGLAGLRKVTHCFGLDTGFVTVIEPDLLCEVKGENYLNSLWTWLGGYIGGTIISRYGAPLLLAAGRRKAVQSILRFGIKLSNKGGPIARVLRGISSRLASMFPGISLGGKLVDQWRPRFLVGYVRNWLLQGIYAKIGSNASISSISEEIANALKAQGNLLGSDAIEKGASQALAAQFDTGLVNALNSKGFTIDSKIVKDLREAFSHNLNLVEGKVAPAIDSIVQNSVSEFVARQWLESTVINGVKASIGDSELVTELASKFGTSTVEGISEGVAAMSDADLAGEAVNGVIDVKDTIAAAGIAAGPEAWIPDLIFQLITTYALDGVSTWLDDRISLVMAPLQYRGVELSAGIDGHQDGLILRAYDQTVPKYQLTPDQLQALHNLGLVDIDIQGKRAIQFKGQQTQETPTAPVSPASEDPNQSVNGLAVTSPLAGVPGIGGSREQILDKHPMITGTDREQLLNTSFTNTNLIGLLDMWAANGISIKTSAVRSDHSPDSGLHCHSVGDAFDVIQFNENVIDGTPLQPDAIRAIRLAGNYSGIYDIGIQNGDGAPFYPKAGDNDLWTQKIGYAYLYNDGGTGPHIHFAVK